MQAGYVSTWTTSPGHFSKKHQSFPSEVPPYCPENSRKVKINGNQLKNKRESEKHTFLENTQTSLSALVLSKRTGKRKAHTRDKRHVF